MIADPEGPSFITRTVGRRRYAGDASVSHGTNSPWHCDVAIQARANLRVRVLNAVPRACFASREIQRHSVGLPCASGELGLAPCAGKLEVQLWAAATMNGSSKFPHRQLELRHDGARGGHLVSLG